MIIGGGFLLLIVTLFVSCLLVFTRLIMGRERVRVDVFSFVLSSGDDYFKFKKERQDKMHIQVMFEFNEP